ncbi:hypothetical protein ABIA48_002230 [Pseudomonas sp. S30_BP2TU TE3576]|uniref:hypothetical protein n=1 Tax=Pseudomonas sp. S30_BP2TU TE3576 TaxID=3349329 RepID=UPI003D220E79
MKKFTIPVERFASKIQQFGDLPFQTEAVKKPVSRWWLIGAMKSQEPINTSPVLRDQLQFTLGLVDVCP